METLNTQKTPALSTHIAGIPHRKPDLSVLHVGNEVTIRHEPDNKFDPNPLKVLHNGVHLGYIPRLETGVWQRFAVAYITEIVPDRKWTEVKISTVKPE